MINSAQDQSCNKTYVASVNRSRYVLRSLAYIAPHIQHELRVLTDDFEMSHPPATDHGSSALDLVHYLHPSTPWTVQWYTAQNPLPPSLQNNSNIQWTASSVMSRTSKTFSVCVLFADLSICWFSVTTPVPVPSHQPTLGNFNDRFLVTCQASYLPRPQPLDHDTLVAAHYAYGSLIADFAEQFAATRKVCARGECWDLANEALKHAAQQHPSAPPIGSLSRTHGHLIYSGRADGVGRWRGGDDRVRRGDIAEWRTARLRTPDGGWATLGDPDHTAIITRDTVPLRASADGVALGPAELGALEVVEQSVGSPPQRRTYALSGLEQGELWIYRPVAMGTYVGAEFGPSVPQGVGVLSL